jgi:hypothetical protein
MADWSARAYERAWYGSQWSGGGFWTARSFPEIPAPDATAPAISDVTPASGSELGPNDPIGFRITDAYGNLERTNVYAYFPRTRLFEVVFFRAITGPWGSRPEGFAPKYIGNREVVEAGKNFLFSSILREGGWPEPPVIIPDPIDDVGNEAA